MTSLAQQAVSQCPNTKVVLSGYSQGGFVVHVAAESFKPLGGKSVLPRLRSLLPPPTFTHPPQDCIED